MVTLRLDGLFTPADFNAVGVYTTLLLGLTIIRPPATW